MTAGLNSRPKEWSRPPEPHPPDAGYWCSRRKRRPYVSLIWCSAPSGHGNGLKPWIRNNDRRAAHEPVNLPLDCKHAHVSSHLVDDLCLTHPRFPKNRYFTSATAASTSTRMTSSQSKPIPHIMSPM